MANTTADKLALLEATKADLKAALAEKGQTVGDVFSTYPAAVRAIETGGGTATVTCTPNASAASAYIDYVSVDGEITNIYDFQYSQKSFVVPVNSMIVVLDWSSSSKTWSVKSGSASVFDRGGAGMSSEQICYTVIFVTGDCVIGL